MSSKPKSPLVRINLGSTWIDRSLWERARAEGFSRQDLREMIVGNGAETLANHFDALEVCPHGHRPAWECSKCEPWD